MAQREVKVTIDTGAISQMVTTGVINESTKRAADKAKFYAQSVILTAGRVDTGEMLRGLEVRREVSRSNMSVYRLVSTSKHSMVQEKGRGPVKGNPVLRFKPKGSGKFVFARSVRGFSGIHFMEKALKSVRAADFKRKV